MGISPVGFNFHGYLLYCVAMTTHMHILLFAHNKSIFDTTYDNHCVCLLQCTSSFIQQHPATYIDFWFKFESVFPLFNLIYVCIKYNYVFIINYIYT